jgi:methionyl-tRNA formyltransferase
MIETLRGLERGEITPRPQDHSQATLAPMLKKEDGRIDWNLTAQEIAWRVRGLRPWPGAYTSFRGKNLHVWAAAVSAPEPQSSSPPGALVAEAGRLVVSCGGGTRLEIKELQVEGRRRIAARDFLNGVRLAPGEILI